MSKIIAEWLSQRLGIIFNADVWNNVKNGVLLAQILESYGLITSDQVNNLQDPEHSVQVQNYIKAVLKNLGVDFTDEDYNDILKGRQSKATKLLYQLYLIFHDSSNYSFAVDAKFKALIPESGPRFQVEAVKDDIRPQRSQDELQIPVIESRHIIDWYKAKHERLLRNCEKFRDKYLTFMEQYDKLPAQYASSSKCTPNSPTVIDLASLVPSKDEGSCHFDYQTLLEQEKLAQQEAEFQPNQKEAKKIYNQIKRRRRLQQKELESKAQYQNILLRELWEKAIAEQEEAFKMAISEKMVKQSMYEQQMMERLLQVERQKDIIMANYKDKLQKIQEARIKHAEEEAYEEVDANFERKIIYYAEKQRKIDLHQMLYKQKLMRKAKKHYDYCEDTLNSIIDMSMYQSEFVDTFNEIVPRRINTDLTYLFVTHKPIFNIIRNVDEVIKYAPSEKSVDMMEKVLIAELDRQNCIDDMTFEAYNNFQWPWVVEPDGSFNLLALQEYFNVLGHIVHRLLAAKYPLKNLPPPPVLQKDDVAACVNGLQDFQQIHHLQRLLNGRNIRVVLVENALDYCVQKYKEETEDLPEPVDVQKEEPKKVKKPPAKGHKNKDTKSKSSRKSSDKQKETEAVTPVVNEVASQTPKQFPDEEHLSPVAEIGKILQDVMKLGQTPNDYLTTAAIIQYLQSLPPNNGWVLINYPQTIEQAALLEEHLTSVRVPVDVTQIDSIDEITDVQAREVEANDMTDENLVKRLSQLVPNPDPEEIVEYDTYLTAFIEMKRADNDDDEQEYYNQFKSADGDTQLNQFYIEQGCKYTLCYKKLDFPAIKHLAKLIIGDYSVPPKKSLELLSDAMYYVEADMEKVHEDTSVVSKEGQARGKGKKKKSIKEDTSTRTSKQVEKESVKKKKSKDSVKKDKKSKNTSKKKKKSSSASENSAIVVITKEDKETQIPEGEITPTEVEPEEPKVLPMPGQKDWLYTKLPMPLGLEVALATLWENCEDVYTTDFKQLMFRRRTQENAIVPYVAAVSKMMQYYLTRPDDKQRYVTEFQKVFNEFEGNMLEDEEVKAELHYRIKEFQEKLYTICDTRMLENEETRKAKIAENWTTEFLYEITNIFVNAMQLEIDRTADTLQLLIDYYSGIVSGKPNENKLIEKVILSHISSTSHDDHSELVQYVQDVLTDVEKTGHDSPYQGYLLKTFKKCQHYVETLDEHGEHVGQQLISQFNPNSKVQGGKGQKVKEPSQEVRGQSQQIVDELWCALRGEIKRCKLRLHILKHVGSSEIDETLSKLNQMFHEAYNMIADRYASEIKAIDQLCDVLDYAVEAELRIQPELRLEDDKFIINTDVMLLQDDIPKDVPLPQITISDNHFSVEQLRQIAQILHELAPSGIIPERAFTFLLQDLITKDSEDGKCSLVPKLWMKTQPHQIMRLMKILFLDSEFMDWRDFIVLNLPVPFPNQMELLQARVDLLKLDPDRSEMIQDYQLLGAELWFDSALTKSLNQDVKNLLAELYKVTDGMVNYSAMLLGFCKDEDPGLGLAKALTLGLGKEVCYDFEKGTVFAENIRQVWLEEELIEQEKEVTHVAAVETSIEVCNDLVDRTVHETTSLTIVDLTEAPNNNVCSSSSISSPINNPEYDIKSFSCSDSLHTIISQGGVHAQTEVGHESVEPAVIYYLSFDVLINVLAVCLPWLARGQNVGATTSFRQQIGLVYEAKRVKKPPYQPFVHEFLRDEDFLELLKGVYKFYYRDVSHLVKQLIDGNETQV